MSMGFVINHRVETIRCEYRACAARIALTTELNVPKPVWMDVVPDLARAVREGWAVVLVMRLKAYCPDHQAGASRCCCKRMSKPERAKRCVACDPSCRELLWNSEHVPEVVAYDPAVRQLMEVSA